MLIPHPTKGSWTKGEDPRRRPTMELTGKRERSYPLPAQRQLLVFSRGVSKAMQ